MTSTTDLIGNALTVLGPVAPDTLGVVLPHEHLFVEMHHCMVPPDDPAALAVFEAPLGIEILGELNYGRRLNREDCGLASLDTAITEAARFRDAGGSTIVDVTSVGIGRNPRGLESVARATGLNIVMGSSYYVEEVQPDPDQLRRKGAERIAEEIVDDVLQGVDDTGIRAGIIGEVGCSAPLTAMEIEVLRASAMAQITTGAPLSIHPGRHAGSPFEIVDVLNAAGADLERTVMCHVERTLSDRDSLARLADSGCYLEYDLFGFESSHYPWEIPVDLPNDAVRLDWLRWLIERGHRKRLLLSHDICFKRKLASHGGHGYAHIPRNVVPLMRRKGFSEDEIRTLLVGNPGRLLTFARPR